MTRRRRSGGVILLACTIGIGPTLSAATPAKEDQPTLRLFDLTTAHGIVDREPDRPARVFTPDDNPIYVWFHAEGCAIGTTITSVWSFLDSDPPIRIKEGAVTVAVLDDWGQFNFELAPGRRWPTGEYRVELRVGETALADVTFRVAEDTGLPDPGYAPQTRRARWDLPEGPSCNSFRRNRSRRRYPSASP